MMQQKINKILNALKAELKEEQVTVNETVRELHGRDESYHEQKLPDFVVFLKQQKM